MITGTGDKEKQKAEKSVFCLFLLVKYCRDLLM